MRSIAEITRLMLGLHYFVSVCLCACGFLADPDWFLSSLLFLSLLGTSAWLYQGLNSNQPTPQIRGLFALDACVAVSFVVSSWRALRMPDEAAEPKALAAAKAKPMALTAAAEKKKKKKR